MIRTTQHRQGILWRTLAGTGTSMLLLSSASCEKPNTYVPPPAPQVVVSQPIEGPVTPYLELTGNTQAIKTVELRARVEGYLEKILFREGEIVKEGQLLFLIQQNTYEAKLKEAKAQVLADKARLMHAETEYVRFSGLLKQNAAAQTDVDKWHYERDSAQAAVMAAEANVDLAKLNLDYTEVRAPFTGRAGRRMKDPGNLVGAGEKTVLAEINQIDPIYAYFTISEQDLLRVRGRHQSEATSPRMPDVPVALGLVNEDGYPHQGKLDFAGIRLDPTTGTLLLRAIFPNPDYSILPGLFARLKAPVDNAQSALLIPTKAISYDQIGPYVLVVNDKNLVERRSITTGPPSGLMISVSDGLKNSDWLIIDGLLRAIPGKEVAPVRQPLSASPAGNPPGAAGR
ncbi:efflux RND transporter periplasmic adaptor subunit [Methylococcus mesophilus]|uniref:efflux RND transporter periplasmic adaptor subunit n=1 Tax=Methylococcus mesophilus TaxID=2993564 RepID=UPI00224A62EF|nr:efflux RND transporter periplasmic adaptor subunit [Methylococcus mesophilus]UZR29601.1 efflux RND transporter periplasmic adaptor subunit [Methylococcus mesophilus]